MNKYILLKSVILIILLLAGCGVESTSFECKDSLGCVTFKADEALKLGVIQALSGGASSTGVDYARTVEIALADINNQLLNHPIEIEQLDGKCTAEGGANATLKAISNPQVIAIIGTTCSGAAKTAAKIMSEAGLVMISGANAAPSLTAIGNTQGTNWQAGYFRTMYNGAMVGEATANFAFDELNIKKVAVINDGDTYTTGYSAMFQQSFTTLGGDVVLELTINKGDTDMTPILNAIIESEAELLFLPIFQPEADLIVQQAKQIEAIESVVIVGGDALLSDKFIESVSTDGEGMYLVGPALLQGEAIDNLATKYQTTYGEAPFSQFYSYAYDATNILLKAIETVAIQEEDGTLHIGRQALRDQLYATANFKGLTGILTCTPYGDCAAPPTFEFMQLTNPSAGLSGLKLNVVYTYKTQN